MSGKTSAVLVLCLFLIVVGLFVAKGLSDNYAPMQQAEAKRIDLQAEAQAARDALQIKNDTIRSEIMTRAIAERDKKILLDQAEAKRIGDLNELNARYQAQQADIQRQIDWTHALSIGGVIVISGISVALVLCAFAFWTHVHNKAQVVTVGSTAIVMKGDQMFQPENSLDRYTAVEKVPRWAKAIIWLRISFAFNPRDDDADAERHWRMVDRARLATQPHISNSQVDYPDEVAQIREAQLQLDGIKALAKRMSSAEAKDAAGTLTLPRPQTVERPPEVGWLPAPENKDAYHVLELGTEEQ